MVDAENNNKKLTMDVWCFRFEIVWGPKCPRSNLHPFSDHPSLPWSTNCSNRYTFVINHLFLCHGDLDDHLLLSVAHKFHNKTLQSHIHSQLFGNQGHLRTHQYIIQMVQRKHFCWKCDRIRIVNGHPGEQHLYTKHTRVSTRDTLRPIKNNNKCEYWVHISKVILYQRSAME